MGFGAALLGGAFLVPNPNLAWTRPDPAWTSGRRVPMNEEAAAAEAAMVNVCWRREGNLCSEVCGNLGLGYIIYVEEGGFGDGDRDFWRWRDAGRRIEGINRSEGERSLGLICFLSGRRRWLISTGALQRHVGRVSVADRKR